LRWRKEAKGSRLHNRQLRHLRHQAAAGNSPNVPDPIITAELAVGEVMRRWPATIGVFIRHRMGCVGCAMAEHDSIEVASAEYAVPLGRLLAELEAAATAAAPVSAADPRRSSPGHGDRG
jgi:hybrid cluster-associated redox disulfide protein